MSDMKQALKRVGSVLALVVLTAALTLPLVGCGSAQASKQEVDDAILAYWENDVIPGIRSSGDEELARELEEAGPFATGYGSYNHAVMVDGQTIVRYQSSPFTYEGDNMTGFFSGDNYFPFDSPAPMYTQYDYDEINKYVNGGSWTLIIHDGKGTDMASITDGKVTFLVESPPIP